MRENVRAHLRVLVKRILRKHGPPPDKQEKAARLHKQSSSRPKCCPTDGGCVTMSRDSPLGGR